jgi:hypothetical protein
VATAGGRQAGGRSGACSGFDQIEEWREGMAALLCSLSLDRKTYICEVEGHYRPVAWARPPLSFQCFLFFLSFSMLLCCYLLQWYYVVSTSPYHARHRLSDWKGVKPHASPHRFKNIGGRTIPQTLCKRELHAPSCPL